MSTPAPVGGGQLPAARQRVGEEPPGRAAIDEPVQKHNRTLGRLAPPRDPVAHMSAHSPGRILLGRRTPAQGSASACANVERMRATATARTTGRHGTAAPGALGTCPDGKWIRKGIGLRNGRRNERRESRAPGPASGDDYRNAAACRLATSHYRRLWKRRSHDLFPLRSGTTVFRSPSTAIADK